MKSKEELIALREEVKTLKRKLAELSAEELKEVTGGLTTQQEDAKNPFKDYFETKDNAKKYEHSLYKPGVDHSFIGNGLSPEKD